MGDELAQALALMMQTLGTGPERKYVGTRVRPGHCYTAPGTARCYTAKVRSGDMEHSAHHMCPVTTTDHRHSLSHCDNLSTA